MSDAAATSGCIRSNMSGNQTQTPMGSVPARCVFRCVLYAFSINPRFHKPSTFRQAAQLHSDWVNDILLCNQNQTRLRHLLSPKSVADLS